MCNRIIQDGKALDMRHAIRIDSGVAIWEGHVRNDNNFAKNSMQRVIIPGVTRIEHHNLILMGEFDLIGYTRIIGGQTRVWFETEDRKIGDQDRWPRFAKFIKTAILVKDSEKIVQQSSMGLCGTL